MNVFPASYGMFAMVVFGLLLNAKAANAQTIAEVAGLLKFPVQVGATFSCTGTVDFLITPDKYYFTISDGNDSVIVNINQRQTPFDVEPGDSVAISGHITQQLSERKTSTPSAFCNDLVHLGRADVPQVRTVSIGEVLDGKFPYCHIRVRGIWEDVLVDEIDPNWIYGVLSDGHDRLYVTIQRRWAKLEDFTALVGAEIEIDGVCHLNRYHGRHLFGNYLLTLGRNNVRILVPPPSDSFDVADIKDLWSKRPDKIFAQSRHRTTGLVIAVWGRQRALLRTAEGTVVDVSFADSAPSFGSVVDVVGFPATDFFQINLVRANWRPSSEHLAISEPDTEAVSVERLTTDKDGHVQFQSEYHGSPIRIQGIVRSRSTVPPDVGKMTLECDGGRLLRVDATSCPEALESVEIGAFLSVDGICVAEIESERQCASLPRIHDMTLVIRRKDDVTILQKPSWWTPSRAAYVLAFLLLMLTGIVIWNRLLHRLAERRGRELADEHVARAEADMKVLERTRLAVELHDTVAQNLTGVAFEIDAATRLGQNVPEGMSRHLSTAARTLESCRSELRDCLWDLRSNALEESDMNAAIRQTLLPYVDGVNLSVRFNIPREIFSENTAHAVLRIVRELVVNAIRHGSASHIWIAGSIERDNLLFSVRDNGTGFDPNNAPGVLEGHFGLNGIRERLKPFSGILRIERQANSGMKISAAIRLPRTEVEPT